MEQDVYIDLLFFIDFSMDFLCFYITSKIMHRKIHPIKTVSASVIGGFYSVVVLFIDIVTPLAVLIDAAICVIMCAIVYLNKKDSVKNFLSIILVYVVVCAMLGGLMSAIFNLLNKANTENSIQIKEDQIDVWLFALLALLSGVVTLIGGRLFRKNITKRTCCVVVTIGCKTERFNGLNDSGNLLKDTVSGKCVIPIELKKAMSILPKEITDILSDNGSIGRLDKISLAYAQRIRLIPGHTAAGNTLITAFIPDSIEIITEDGKSHKTDAMIAPLNLSDREIESLVPDELMI